VNDSPAANEEKSTKSKITTFKNANLDFDNLKKFNTSNQKKSDSKELSNKGSSTPSSRVLTLSKSEHPKESSKPSPSDDSFNVNLFGKSTVNSNTIVASFNVDSVVSNFIDSVQRNDSISVDKKIAKKFDEYEQPRSFNPLENFLLSKTMTIGKTPKMYNSEYDLCQTLKSTKGFQNEKIKMINSQRNMIKVVQRKESVQSILSNTNSLPIKVTSKKILIRKRKKKKKTGKYDKFRQKIRLSSEKTFEITKKKKKQSQKKSKMSHKTNKSKKSSLKNSVIRTPNISIDKVKDHYKKMNSKSADRLKLRPRIISRTRYVSKMSPSPKNKRIIRITRSYSPISKMKSNNGKCKNSLKKTSKEKKKKLTKPITRIRPKTRFVDWKRT
jgi:hypothetical protein